VAGWLREMGASEHAAHEPVANAVNRIDAGLPIGDPHNHVEGRTVDGLLTVLPMHCWRRRSWSSSAGMRCHLGRWGGETRLLFAAALRDGDPPRALPCELGDHGRGVVIGIH
jgi:hypothetical protein